MDLALNNLQRLICHKTKQTKPFCVGGQYVGPWLVGSVCEASRSVFFSEGVPSGISSSHVREVCLCCWLMALCCRHTTQKGTRKIVFERKKESMCLD